MLTTAEEQLIALALPGCHIHSVKRMSDRLHDVEIIGTYGADHPHQPSGAFMAWLPLSAIHHMLDWCSPEIASMTDYPEMAAVGDWSGVRDSSPAAIWAIFDKYISLQSPNKESNS